MTGSFFTTVKHWRINSPECARVMVCMCRCSGCLCVDGGMHVQSDSLRLKSTFQMWHEAWVHLRLMQRASQHCVCVEWLLLCAGCHPEGCCVCACVTVCVSRWVPSSSFLPGKTLLSLLALPIMPRLSPLICATRLAETKWDDLVDTSLSARMSRDRDMKVAIL